ncbi:MAG: class I SAM-dependent methyltransferase [Candidatus Cloacimonetes bacterium]|nr:class I SAM-dependent methyltransferase [Candidatus Cloacimonadota bacterium]
MQFNFGENWKEFSEKALTPAMLDAAGRDFDELTAGLPLDGSSFLDIGFGQGMSLILAHRRGAKCVGNDINPLSREILAYNLSQSGLPDVSISTVTGSILERGTRERIREIRREFDIVHSWGVLHHTGDMWGAIKLAGEFVAPKGHLILALYNLHWSCPAWHGIKLVYNKSPRWIQRLMIRLLYPVIFVAKWVVTRQDPRSKERGMDFYYDVIDWVGGYPYEYASESQVVHYMKRLGFECTRIIPADVPTGCNNFVFRKMDAPCES